MNLLTFDIGGTYVKYNVWNGTLLNDTQKFKTPDNYLEIKNNMKEIKDSITIEIDGVALSAPGSINQKYGVIEGISAVQYMHNFPLQDDLEKTFGVPVTIENDANCSGICEMEMGAGKDSNNVAFLVLGTGVGGAVFLNRQLYRGTSNRSGEFGLTINNGFDTLSQVGTIVKILRKHEEITGTKVSGEELFELDKRGDQLASELIHAMYDELALFIYNIQVVLDLELIILGGGVSAQKGINTEIEKRVKVLLAERNLSDFIVNIETSHYKNDANLIGAALAFKKIR